MHTHTRVHWSTFTRTEAHMLTDFGLLHKNIACSSKTKPYSTLWTVRSLRHHSGMRQDWVTPNWPRDHFGGGNSLHYDVLTEPYIREPYPQMTSSQKTAGPVLCDTLIALPEIFSPLLQMKYWVNSHCASSVILGMNESAHRGLS